MPLFNSYAALAPPGHKDDPRLHPALAKLETLPRDLLLVIPQIDILLHEQLAFVQRLKAEIEDAEHAGAERAEAVKGRRVESVLYKNMFHAGMELPKGVIDEGIREDMFRRGIQFVKEVNEKYGFRVEEH